MSVRDANTDSARMGGGVMGRGGECGPVTYKKNTIEEQNMMGGMNNTDIPVGGPHVWQDKTTGSRGAPDSD